MTEESLYASLKLAGYLMLITASSISTFIVNYVWEDTLTEISLGDQEAVSNLSIRRNLMTGEQPFQDLPTGASSRDPHPVDQ